MKINPIVKNILIIVFVPSVVAAGYYGWQAYKKIKENKLKNATSDYVIKINSNEKDKILTSEESLPEIKTLISKIDDEKDGMIDVHFKLTPSDLEKLKIIITKLNPNIKIEGA